jgi:hypothetical protein
MKVSCSNGFAPGDVVRWWRPCLVGDWKIQFTGVFPLFNATDATLDCKNDLVSSQNAFPQGVRLLFCSLRPSKFGDEISSFADPECLSRILDPGSKFFPSHFQDPGSKFFSSWIPDPGSEFFPSQILDPWCALKNSSILTKRNGVSALRNMIRVLHPGSGSRIGILTFYLSRIPILDHRCRIQGSKRHQFPDSGSRIRIRNTGDFRLAQAVGGSVDNWLSTGAAVLTTHSMDQLSEAFMCKKEFSVYFIFTISL